MSYERRFATELRSDSQGDEMSLVGRAAGHNHLSKNLGGFREFIAPGAFSRALNEKQDVKCLWNHDPNHVLGRTKSGTLQLTENAAGLNFRCKLPDTAIARDLHESIKRGDVSECSFGFMVRSQVFFNSLADARKQYPVQVTDPDDNSDDSDDDNIPVRCLRDCDLFDVSPVCNPAYGGSATTVHARALLFPEGFSPETRSAMQIAGLDSDALIRKYFATVKQSQEEWDAKLAAARLF